MIKNYFVTGDTHGKVADRLSHIDKNPDETAVIILGDAGLNFYLNKTDKKEKQKVQDSGFIVYCVRGNHEERPENIPGMKSVYDPRVEAEVWMEEEYPNILYLKDGDVYNFNGHSTLVIGGAYSVDKYYRLSRYHNGQSHFLGWFKDEQLSQEEMNEITTKRAGHHYDFILSHTCPYSWMPTDLFLSGLDQSTVDNSMELWFEQFKDQVSYGHWLFGHYHDDRLVRPGVEMYYTDIEDLETIINRWKSPENLEWWLNKDSNYYMGR